MLYCHPARPSTADSTPIDSLTDTYCSNSAVSSISSLMPDSELTEICRPDLPPEVSLLRRPANAVDALPLHYRTQLPKFKSWRTMGGLFCRNLNLHSSLHLLHRALWYVRAWRGRSACKLVYILVPMVASGVLGPLDVLLFILESGFPDSREFGGRIYRILLQSQVKNSWIQASRLTLILER